MEKSVYQGHYLRVSEEQIGERLYERAYFKNSIVVLPITDDGKIIFILEERPHETPQVRWKTITGFIEEGLSLEENVNLELQEEIGYKARKTKLYFDFRTSGSLNTLLRFVLASGLSPSKLPNPDGEESVKETRALSLEEIYERTMNGEFARGLVGYGLLKLCLEVREGKIKLS